MVRMVRSGQTLCVALRECSGGPACPSEDAGREAAWSPAPWAVNRAVRAVWRPGYGPFPFPYPPLISVFAEDSGGCCTPDDGRDAPRSRDPAVPPPRRGPATSIARFENRSEIAHSRRRSRTAASRRRSSCSSRATGVQNRLGRARRSSSGSMISGRVVRRRLHVLRLTPGL